MERSSLKSVLGNCDRYGVDHRTSANLTPLMLAAEMGNLALIDALMERGADRTQTDLFGRTPHLLALNRAFEDRSYASRTFGAVDERLRPGALEVLIDDRLVRFSPDGAEFYFLSALLASLPNFHSDLHDPPISAQQRARCTQGFLTDFLQIHLDDLPLSVLKEARRKRAYFNHALARAEVDSNYLPARQLWKRSSKGFYQLNPTMQVRLRMEASVEGERTSVLLLSGPLARG